MSKSEFELDREVIEAASGPNENWGDVVETDFCDYVSQGPTHFRRPFAESDAAFIARARTRWPAALDEIDRLKEEIGHWAQDYKDRHRLRRIEKWAQKVVDSFVDIGPHGPALVEALDAHAQLQRTPIAIDADGAPAEIDGRAAGIQRADIHDQPGPELVDCEVPIDGYLTPEYLEQRRAELGDSLFAEHFPISASQMRREREAMPDPKAPWLCHGTGHGKSTMPPTFDVPGHKGRMTTEQVAEWLNSNPADPTYYSVVKPGVILPTPPRVGTSGSVETESPPAIWTEAELAKLREETDPHAFAQQLQQSPMALSCPVCDRPMVICEERRRAPEPPGGIKPGMQIRPAWHCRECQIALPCNPDAPEWTDIEIRQYHAPMGFADAPGVYESPPWCDFCGAVMLAGHWTETIELGPTSLLKEFTEKRPVWRCPDCGLQIHRRNDP